MARRVLGLDFDRISSQSAGPKPNHIGSFRKLPRQGSGVGGLRRTPHQKQ